jgi:hypothetical protein
MGGQSWWYLVPYEKDIGESLNALRQREFNAGRYNPAEPFPRFPVDPAHTPGRKHSSINEARIAADADGTRSILDVSYISAEPNYDAVALLDDANLMKFFGTTKPTAADMENSAEMFDQIERGMGIYAIVYEDDAPSQIFFAGYSYD